ncbi:Uncharacterized protein FKW44_016472 [Caligus rogercresseyi]|uniref:Uncharacterized protein n=1 Tax=Caligus rogercresseyi TaxID=217165 RepID=A0A7T8K0F9_CALRO|nr:Uncharacterized protein FKW44_016472 [Caligus rogercresseyi]
MEQTRRDTVIELLCAGLRPPAIIKLFKYSKRTDYRHQTVSGGFRDCPRGRSPRPGVTDLHAHIWAGLKRSIKANSGTLMDILARKRGVYLSSFPGWTLCASGTPVHIPAGLGARPQGQFVHPYLNPCDYYFMEVGEGVVRHTTQQCGTLKASIKSAMNKLDPAESPRPWGGSGVCLEDILEAEGGHIE